MRLEFEQGIQMIAAAIRFYRTGYRKARRAGFSRAECFFGGVALTWRYRGRWEDWV